MKIWGINVYGIKESLVASGFPMQTGDMVNNYYRGLSEVSDGLIEKHLGRATKLGNVATGTGHDNFCKGIIVQFNIDYPQYFTPQFQRYNFADIVSSTSKMHRITKMDIKGCCNEYVDDVVIDNLNSWVEVFNEMKDGDTLFVIGSYKKICRFGQVVTVKPNAIRMTKYDVFMRIISNTPSGLEQSMRITTNYLQLKTIYLQRRYHKLKGDWGKFCAWCESLPHFVELCLSGRRIFTDVEGRPLDNLHNWEGK